MVCEIVGRRFDVASRAETADVLDQQVRLERVGVVVVQRGALLEAQIVAVAVVPVVFEDGHLLRAQAFDDAPDDGGLAGAGAAGDADEDGSAGRGKHG